MNKQSIARLAIISSLLYAVGFIGYVVNRGSESSLTTKLVTGSVMFAVLALPAILFYAIHLRGEPRSGPAWRPTVLCMAAGLFLLIWIGWTPLITRAMQSDPLGALGIVWVPVCQIGTWLLVALALAVSAWKTEPHDGG
jgi:hypothetical protein